MLSLLVGAHAPPLELQAGEELKRMLERLFDVDVQVGRAMDDESATAHLIIGRPETNSLLAQIAGQDWPNLSDQGLLLRRLRRPTDTFVVGGGSAVATLWAVYELGERLGVRYLHDRDIFPERRAWPGLPQLDAVMEPNLRIRCWRLINELPHGPVSWSLDENKRFLRQMAKMKFNRVRIQVWPAQPFVNYWIRGIPKPKGVIFFGQRFPIDTDTIGLEQFAGLAEFTNPEFVGAETAQELHERAVHLLRGILEEARRLGMETALAFEPAEWPRAFQKVLPGTEPVHQVGALTIGPGSSQSMDDPSLRDATATVIQAYTRTYPEVDYLIFSMPEHGRWTAHAGEAFRRLVDEYDTRGTVESFDELCARARARSDFPGGGERVERQLKNDLSSLWFLDSLVRQYGLLSRLGGGPDIKLVYDSVTEELFPLVARVVPSGGEVVSFIDYTASRQLRHRELLKQVPPREVPACLLFTLADDNVGVLPQLATGSLHQLMGLLRENRWSGFYTRYWTIGDLDPTIHLLARGSWDASLTVQDAYADQVRHTCGPAAVEPALQAFGTIERITQGLDEHLGFAFPTPGMMTQHYDACGLPEQISQYRQLYCQALRLMREAHAASRPDGRGYIAYFVGRLEFVVRYLDAAESFAAAAAALRDGRGAAVALRHADVAYVAIREAIQAYADVARDHGDLGAIAAMNEYCYRPIRDVRNELRGSCSAAAILLDGAVGSTRA